MEEEVDISSLMPQIKGTKFNKKKSGGFQSMGLSHPVLRAVLKKGYKVPTPIQRKAIPVVMRGKNVIAMARTGSGKTAAFLVPMLEKLKCRVPKTGARALIFSPTRELAIQTMKFTKELSINSNLKAILVLGGERIEDQFAAIHESPDIIIATPGRFLHVVVEMDLKLSSVEYLVFDEADRLFEMGFQEQLQEIVHRLSSERQTVLFSATLPKILVDFVKMGIDDPVLIRLDIDLQISENLKSNYLMCRNGDKISALLYLLKNVVDLSKELTVVFLATKHHVEYMKDILERASIPCSYIYSSLDQMARNINIGKFKARKVGVLLVTDIAARGIDIPLLDNVINYNFPSKPKLYVHRVGRVARAGRCGRAFSLVSSDEMPYLLDLHLFLGKPIKLSKENLEDEDDVCGTIPQGILDDEADLLQSWHELSVDMTNMIKVTRNAYKMYLKSRPTPSNESVKRMKQLNLDNVAFHPIFKDSTQVEKSKILSGMKNYRPNTTIFELGHLAKTHAHVMREKRKKHDIITKQKNAANNSQSEPEIETKTQSLESASESDLTSLMQNSSKQNSKRQKVNNYKDPEHYLTYVASTHYREKGLGLENTFERQADSAVLDFTGDDNEMAKNKKSARWDREKKKFIRGNNDKAKKMKTESGVWIPKSFKTDIYKKWQDKNKVKYQEDSDNDDEGQLGKQKGLPNHIKNKRKGNGGQQNKGRSRPPRREMKNKEEILKARNRKEFKSMHHQKKRNKLKATKNFRNK